MDLLRAVVRPYAWGSRDAIAGLQGRPVPSAGPEAELWMGAHASAPCAVERDGGRTTLDAVIAARPGRELGTACAASFGARLPFLLKVLAADQALSIQVHPSHAQAEAGFRAENERGLAPGDPARNYGDDWPNPQLPSPLTPFDVMPAGGLHAYRRGPGVELPANSDNVVRAGLTGKHVDVPELLKLLDPDVQVPVLSPRVIADGITVYDTPAPEFRLYRIDLAGNALILPGAGARILLCTEGAAVLRNESGDTIKIGRGESCFVSAADGAVRATGPAY